MKTVKIISLSYFLLLAVISCKKETQIKESQIKAKNVEAFTKKEICDINQDNIKDTIILKAISQKGKFTFNFDILIKCSHDNGYKTKKINFNKNPEALFWGVAIDDNGSIRIGYSDEFLWENVYVINYDIKNDGFYIAKYLQVNSRDNLKFQYENFTGYEGKVEDRGGFIELDAISIRRYIVEPTLIKDSLNLSYITQNMEIIKIPKDNSGRFSSEVDAILRIDLEIINKS